MACCTIGFCIMAPMASGFIPPGPPPMPPIGGMPPAPPPIIAIIAAGSSPPGGAPPAPPRFPMSGFVPGAGAAGVGAGALVVVVVVDAEVVPAAGAGVAAEAPLTMCIVWPFSTEWSFSVSLSLSILPLYITFIPPAGIEVFSLAFSLTSPTVSSGSRSREKPSPPETLKDIVKGILAAAAAANAAIDQRVYISVQPSHSQGQGTKIESSSWTKE
mmetsp:Transcript_28212/g.71616  ORF Transcript_28212/g.71616 Transcript_28212/m.71616 type:complete len:215 (-) Transcript_28212:77-721(-)